MVAEINKEVIMFITVGCFIAFAGLFFIIVKSLSDILGSDSKNKKIKKNKKV